MNSKTIAATALVASLSLANCGGPQAPVTIVVQPPPAWPLPDAGTEIVPRAAAVGCDGIRQALADPTARVDVQLDFDTTYYRIVPLRLIVRSGVINCHTHIAMCARAGGGGTVAPYGEIVARCDAATYSLIVSPHSLELRRDSATIAQHATQATLTIVH